VRMLAKQEAQGRVSRTTDHGAVQGWRSAIRSEGRTGAGGGERGHSYHSRLATGPPTRAGVLHGRSRLGASRPTPRSPAGSASPRPGSARSRTWSS
jgi:hypothetical protein